MDNNFKINDRLKLDLNIPDELLEIKPKKNMWEVIVKYNGDIFDIQNDIDVFIEILSTSYAILTLKREDIIKLTMYRQIEYIERPKTLALVLENANRSSCIDMVKNKPYNLSGEGTIVAIIDSGINYLSKEFLGKDGKTRIQYILDQTIVDDNNPAGTVYTKDMIDRAILSQNPYEIVPHKDNIGHGSYVSAIATGLSNGVAQESNIIVVKIGERGRKFFARDTEIMRGIKFVLDKAIEINMPIAINISFGTNDGGHTGGSLFETYIDDMANIWKSSIVVASGNEGNTSHHYKGDIKTGQKDSVEIKTSGDLKNLNITLFKNFVDDFSFNIILQDGSRTPNIQNNSKTGEFNFRGVSIFYYISEPTPYSINQSILFQLSSKDGFLPEGIFNLEIVGENIVKGEFDIWLPVTESVSRDTKFLRPSIETTLTIPSTAKNVITVGGYNDKTGAIANFSGRGYTAIGEVKPDIVAPAVNIAVLDTVLGTNIVTGTSVAAPFVTGSCAMLMQWGIVEKNDLFLYGQRLKAFLRLGAKREDNINYPNIEWGYGKLCLKDSLNQLELYGNSIDDIVNIQKIDENDIEEIETEDAIYSEDYTTRIAQYNNEIEQLLKKYTFIKYCKTKESPFIVLYVPTDKLIVLESDIAYKMLVQFPFTLGTMDTTALQVSGVLAVQNQPSLALKGSGVLIGIIDTGINYTLDEFIYEDGTTKIVSIWDQAIRGKRPKGQCYGTEYTREDIDKALKSKNPYDIVPSRDEDGHGTNLASICAGFENKKDNFIGVAPDSELVVVKLKQIKNYTRERNFIKKDTSAFNSADIMFGLEYLFKKARELDKPISICIGLGTNDGTHNGFSILEQHINSIGIRNGVSISICTGNEGGSAHHTLFKLTEPEKERSVEINVGEKEDGIIVTFVAYPSDKIGVNIVSPLGERTGRIPPRDNYDEEINFALSGSKIRVRYFSNIFESSGQVVKISIKTPSAGIWKVNVYGERLLLGDVHAWLPITNFVGNDVYFLESDPFYTVTTPATSNIILSVGGYNDLDGSLYAKSGRGPTRMLSVSPNISAPSVNVSAIGNTGIGDVTGTSIGTAITAGCAGLILEWGLVKGNDMLMNTTSIISYLINGAEKKDNEIYPNNLVGFGKLNILETFKKI